MRATMAGNRTSLRATNWVSTTIRVYNCEVVIDVDVDMMICNKMVYRDELPTLKFLLLWWALVKGTT